MNRSSQKNLRKERLRLSRKRRKRKKFTSSLGAPFNVVAVTDRIASNWAADFSLGDSVTDGLGGTWTLSGTKQNDPNAKRTGSAPDSTQGSTRIPFASTRTPRMLGSLNVLDLYENDLISVTGSCDENGNNKGSVKRKPIAPLASSKTASKTKSKTKSRTTSKRIPIHKPNDVKARWWYGTIVRSGRGLVDGKWPLNDRRQRTGRFPQNAILLYNASKRTFGNIKNNCFYIVLFLFLIYTFTLLFITPFNYISNFISQYIESFRHISSTKSQPDSVILLVTIHTSWQQHNTCSLY